jgi:hypothetical protein
MQQVSVSEIQRNLHKLNDFDIIEVLDKKRNKVKGYFIDGKYASFVEEVSAKISESKKENRKSLRGILSQYADVSKWEQEKDAWKNHVIAKHSIK